MLLLDPFDGLPDHENRLRKGVCEMFVIWRPYACKTSLWLWGVVALLFSGILTGVVEEIHTLWHVCLAIMILLLLLVGFASVVYYQDLRHHAGHHGLGRSVDLQP